MTLTFHPDAAIRFDERGNALLGCIGQCSHDLNRVPTFHTDVHATQHLTEKDIIGEIIIGQVDQSGVERARYFREGSVDVGLEGENYQEFAQLIEAIQRTPEFQSVVSQKRLTEVAFDWFRDTRKLATKSTLSEYIANVCSTEICDYEVAVPIALLSVESSLPVGRAIIRPITKSLLDQWFQPILDKQFDDEGRRIREDDLNRKRAKLQGYSAAFVTVRAESIRAQEIAIEEAEAAAALLRYFAGASLSSGIPCYCAPMGKENIQQFQAIVLANGLPKSWVQGLVQRNCTTWMLSTAEIQHVRTVALDALSEMYRNPATELHRRIVDAVLLFSRVSIAKDLSDCHFAG